MLAEKKKNNMDEFKLNSYKQCSCGMDCYMDWNATINDPCWGQTEMIDEDVYLDENNEIIDCSYVHACEGHKSEYEGTRYKKSLK